MTLDPVRIISAFFAALIIVYLSAKFIGPEKKNRWFRKRRKYSLFTRRGLLGETCHFGVPCTLEGYLATLAMFLLIVVTSYLIVFVF